MFWKKSKEPTRVKCDECKHLIERDDAQKVALAAENPYYMRSIVYENPYAYTPFFKSDIYFCPEHKVKYDKMYKYTNEKKNSFYKIYPIPAAAEARQRKY